MARVVFGEFELDEERALLQVSGVPVKLHPKPLAVLVYLMRHRERVVSRDELLGAVWPGISVSDQALWSAVRDLRRALGDTDTAARIMRPSADVDSASLQGSRIPRRSGADRHRHRRTSTACGRPRPPRPTSSTAMRRWPRCAHRCWPRSAAICTPRSSPERRAWARRACRSNSRTKRVRSASRSCWVAASIARRRPRSGRGCR